ncbi:MAG TPA: beta-1,6-N-acetylglucosaminyltransferase [Paracoccaceae bacterium]|nr:beta-1,6-N-acetylglucosaminyltransferase [Paracoccaceae bacterium]
MSLGAVVLAHHRLDRVAQLASSLAGQDCRVALHVDAKAPAADFHALEAACRHPDIAFLRRRDCEWGMFSLVAATLHGVGILLEHWPDISHVCLLSGSCLPIRPVAELQAFLRANGGTDFIESVPVGTEHWVQGGLGEERFTLYFPFSWRRQRGLFDRAVNLQRRIGLRRRPPEGLQPHIGIQWWCLSRETLTAILQDPWRREFDAYFARCWIPDEAYFQTMARRHGTRIVSRSLTLSRFDHQGKPHVFYADHRPLLEASDHFFARKIWPGADELYRHYLDPARQDFRGGGFEGRVPEEPFRAAFRQRREGRPGLLSQARFPSPRIERRPATPQPYLVFEGFDALVPGWHLMLARKPGAVAHGRVFAPGRVELAGGADIYEGNLPANPKIRDYAPEQYLLNLLRQDLGAEVSLQSRSLDSPGMARFFRRDPNARILRLEDGWLLELFEETKGSAEAARALRERIERGDTVGPGETRAQIESWALAVAVGDPAQAIAELLGRVWPGHPKATMPRPAPVQGLADFAASLGYRGAALLAEAERRWMARAMAGADSRGEAG